MIDPIRRTITVRCDPLTAFRVFTDEMDSWWPLDVHSRALERADEVKAERIVVEGHVGGRIYEVMSDGTEGMWGTVEVWEPPARLVIAWKPHDRPTPPTELELRFIASAEGTLVELEHRGWDRLGADGEDSRDAYANGWPLTFDERFGQAADEAAAQ